MLVEMKNIVMEFGPTRAVDNVSITIQPGTVLGLLGENGAGKSTLMNVLAGSYQPTAGEILLDGKKVVMHNAKVANRHGIRFIHQELNLCGDLKVFENMYLGDEISRFGLLKKDEMKAQCAKVLERMRVDIDLEAEAGQLNAAEMQLVEIAKALLFQSELIIMDEPSTALSTHEIENLFTIMRQLREEGVSFIYISHKMPELFEICDRYYVLRDGQLVAEGKFAEIDEDGITELMIGRQLRDEDFSHHVCRATEEVCLQVEGLTSAGFADISFTLPPGGDPGGHRPAGLRPGRAGRRPVRRGPLPGPDDPQRPGDPRRAVHPGLYEEGGGHGAPDAQGAGHPQRPVHLRQPVHGLFEYQVQGRADQRQGGEGPLRQAAEGHVHQGRGSP